MLKPTLIIGSFDIQKLVQEFTLSDRFWTAYSADKLEHMMKYYKVLPTGFYYARFDPKKEELVFQAQPDTEWSLPQMRRDCPRLPAGAKLLKG